MKNIVILGVIFFLIIVFYYAGIELRMASQRELATDPDYVTSLAQTDALQALQKNHPAKIVVMSGWSGEAPSIDEEYYQKCLIHLYKDEIWVGNSDNISPENELDSRPRNTKLYAKVYNETVVAQVKGRNYNPAKEIAGCL